MTVVVDGNNVVGAAADGWWRDPPAAVRRLLERLQCYHRATGRPVVLVLDVPQRDLAQGDHGGVVVHFAERRGRDAGDERVVRWLEAHGGAGVEVITSDRALADAARRRGATTVGAGAFLGRLVEAGC